ncbi:MAG: peptidoglycan bridge formation glycyltransferase FemA/FemB family protein [bacterium]|nr:peptidoglycan bridge formation glycyltransferase FemA/FemB family protein [bacterium]
MEVRELQEKNIWEGFLEGCSEKTFLHSWNWGEFQKAMREKVWRLGFFEGKDLCSVCLLVRVKAKRGMFVLVPHGPVLKDSIKDAQGTKREILSLLLGILKKTAQEEGASFVRINPIWERTQENVGLFKEAGFQRAPMQMHPEASWKLDISLPEDALLSSMRKTTKYLIRQAQKNPDITIEQSDNREDIQTFSKLHKLVSKRQSFTPFSYEYLEREFSLFSKEQEVTLFLGKVKGDIGAASFVLFWSGIGFYHHAVSLPQYTKLSLPYLLQWEAIKEAKRRGCKLYDFWGYVDPFKQPSHPWAGPTLFKMGFGGKAHEYVKTQDYPLKKSYWLLYAFELLRKIRRGL